MQTVGDRVNRISAHGRSYELYESEDPLAGAAAAKTTQLARTGQPYELPLLEHIYSLGLHGTAVDVGANVGNHALWMAAVCGLDVIAFEPLVPFELRANVELNNLAERVEVIPFALGDRQGFARHVGAGRLEAGAGDGDIPVLVRRFDDFGLVGVSVVKIDVEGMEPAVLRGGESTIRRDRPVIFAEEWGEPEHDATAAVLEPWGYEMTYRFSGRQAATPVGKWEHRG